MPTELADGTTIRGVDDVDDESSALDLRAALFWEYRRHNHFGYGPDVAKLNLVYEPLDRLRTLIGHDNLG